MMVESRDQAKLGMQNEINFFVPHIMFYKTVTFAFSLSLMEKCFPPHFPVKNNIEAHGFRKHKK